MKLIKINPENEFLNQDISYCPHIEIVKFLYLVDDQGYYCMLCEDCLRNEGYIFCDHCGELSKITESISIFSENSFEEYHKKCYIEIKNSKRIDL